MAPTVHLHIGTPKSGTTYVQAALVQNRKALAADGVEFPGGIGGQIAAVRDLMQRPPKDRWDRLADEVRDSAAKTTVVSMEQLCRARPATAERAVRAFGDLDVRVVVTARSLSRVVPAQWQESTQFRHSWSYTRYLKGVSSAQPMLNPAGRSFWRQHDLGRIVRTWSGVVGAEKVTVVTLPPRPDPPDLLWRRFGDAVGIDAGRYDPPEVRNASLGAASAELMRRVNERLADDALSPHEYAQTYRELLAKTVLAARSRREPALSLPDDLSRWVTKRTARTVRQVRACGVQVVGELGDLQAQTSTPFVDPADLPTEDILDAAVDAVVGLASQQVDQQRRRRRRTRRTQRAQDPQR